MAHEERSKMMESDGSFELERPLDREEILEWLDELRGGLESHDFGMSMESEMAIFGVGSGDVSVSFEPDESYRGRSSSPSHSTPGS